MSNFTPEIAINFTAPNHRKSLDGLKTQTRRVVTPQPTPSDRKDLWCWEKKGADPYRCINTTPCLLAGKIQLFARYKPGMIAAMRTTWAVRKVFDDSKPSELPDMSRAFLWLESDGPKPDWAGKSRPAMFLPKYLWHLCPKIEFTRVLVETLQDISVADIKAEGVRLDANAETGELLLRVSGKFPPFEYIPSEILQASEWHPSHEIAIWRAHWFSSWDTINHKKHPSASNPWVFCHQYKLREDLQ